MITEIRGTRFAVEDPDTGEFIPISNVISAEITKNTQGANEEKKSVYGFTGSIDGTLQAQIDRYTCRRFVGAETNNESRRHHDPLKRRKPRPGRWMRRHWWWPAIKEKKHGRKARRAKHGKRA